MKNENVKVNEKTNKGKGKSKHDGSVKLLLVVPAYEVLDMAVELLMDFFVGIASVKKDGGKKQKKHSSPSDGVPTEDRIKIPKRVVSQCRTMCGQSPIVSKMPPTKDMESKFRSFALSEDEASEIRLLRRKGMSVKLIAKKIHRRDRIVSAYLKVL